MSEKINRLDKPTRPHIKIVGAADIERQGAPQILDRNSKTDQPVPEIRVHDEIVTEDDSIRKRDRRVDEPEIRVRASDQKRWQAAKRAED